MAFSSKIREGTPNFSTFSAYLRVIAPPKLETGN